MSPDNLTRLAAALSELDARVYTSSEPEGLMFRCDEEMLRRAQIWNLVTRYGRLDISVEPTGTQGYEDLHRQSRVIDIGEGVLVEVASLGDVVRSKEAAGRDKDRVALPLLREMLNRFGEHP